MILHAYSVLDLKGEAFATPFFLHTDGIAIRSFTDAVQDPNSPMHRHAEDYVLYRLGDFDDQTGLLTPLQQPLSLITGLGEALHG